MPTEVATMVRVRPCYLVDDFAADFGVTVSKARAEIREGRLAAFRIGRALVIAGEDALHWRDFYRDAGLAELPKPPGRHAA
jgi:hypothetical protein